MVVAYQLIKEIAPQRLYDRRRDTELAVADSDRLGDNGITGVGAPRIMPPLARRLLLKADAPKRLCSVPSCIRSWTGLSLMALAASPMPDRL